MPNAGNLPIRGELERPVGQWRNPGAPPSRTGLVRNVIKPREVVGSHDDNEAWSRGQAPLIEVILANMEQGFAAFDGRGVTAGQNP